MKIVVPAFLIMFYNLLCQAQTLTRSQAIADIDEYNKVLREVHYNPFLYIDAEAYDRKVDSLKQTLDDTISIKSMLLKVSQLTSALNDGHTMPAVVQPQFKADFRKPIYFPLTVGDSRNGKLYIIDSYTPAQIPSGAILLTVNGLNMMKFYNDVLTYVGGLLPYRKQLALGLLSNYLYDAGVTAPFNVTYSVDGKKYTTTIKEGVILKESLAVAFPQFRGIDYSFRLIDGKVGYLNLITMGDDYKRYGRFFDSCFTTMKKANITTLTIDLRQNTGGNALIAHLLISYFNTKPYALSGGRYWKVSQRYKNYLVSRGDTGNSYLRQVNGTIFDQRQCGPQSPMFTGNKLLFGGKIYLITGPQTYSSATQLADAIKQYHMATVIGQPTGENTNDFGELYRFELPNSKIQMQVTTTFDLGADCNAKKNQPVMPDHLIQVRQKSPSGSKDAVLEYIMKHVN
ncbi:hypothetical protein HH214_05870 [Mucilaginibacter robiniae]|uniref:Tail specific protease domain-containing protein n=1 Tax=Mucilaginibacter robiniae TaxID=2728022 RepID=A0A7L5DWH2_9SPHI|nr:S41 family peptidase [Mucilaginibacter robiniae]QJD95432.1 hypothetical protein HH214_05870 [Mucilaginibacter robiniae]